MHHACILTVVHMYSYLIAKPIMSYWVKSWEQNMYVAWWDKSLKTWRLYLFTQKGCWPTSWSCPLSVGQPVCPAAAAAVSPTSPAHWGCPGRACSAWSCSPTSSHHSCPTDGFMVQGRVSSDLLFLSVNIVCSAFIKVNPTLSRSVQSFVPALS